MNKVLEEFSKIGIIPVIALDNVEDAVHRTCYRVK